MKTFREQYCARYGVALEQFEREVVWRSLYGQAKLLYWLLGLRREYFFPDHDLVRSVGDLRSRRGFRNEAAEYHCHPRNRGFLRTVLRLRLSTQRLREIFDREMTNAETAAPFPADQS